MKPISSPEIALTFLMIFEPIKSPCLEFAMIQICLLLKPLFVTYYTTKRIYSYRKYQESQARKVDLTVDAGCT